MFKSLVAAAAALIVVAAPASAQTTGKAPWETFGDRITESRKINAYGNDAFGDQVSLSNGALSFAATDVSLPGAGPAIAIGRQYEVRDMRKRVVDEMFGDWAAAIPSISAVHKPNWIDRNGGVARCSVGGMPQDIELATEPSDYWQAASIDIPGVTGGEMMGTLPGTPVPSSGGTYPYMTNEGVRISCLPSIKNGTGEGFLAITPDGTKYWFDWMAQHVEPTLKVPNPVIIPGGTATSNYYAIRRNVLYVTKVQDRFGNTVTYSYSNQWNQPGALVSVTSGTDASGTGGDGRKLTLTWSNGRVTSVSDGTGRAWNYQYATTTGGRLTLTRVTQPDGNAWAIDFDQFTDGELDHTEVFMLGEITRNCFLEEDLGTEEPVGTITHPSGATGEFKVGIRRHGRSNVPLSCRNWTTGGSGNDQNDDMPVVPFQYQAWTLLSKKVTGQGLDAALWTYSYTPSISWAVPPGVGMSSQDYRAYPVCKSTETLDCQAPPCTSEACAAFSTTLVQGPGGQWVRHRFGSTYRYNEGKLLQVDIGAGTPPATSVDEPANALRSTRYEYDLSTADDAAYEKAWGDGHRQYGDSWASEYHRPQTKVTITQQGWDFVTHNETFDAFARPLQVARFSQTHAATPVEKYRKTELTTYHDHLGLWVLGQIYRVTHLTSDPNIVTTRINYDPTTAQPISQYFPYAAGTTAKRQYTFGYHANGELASVKDGRNYTTTLGDYYRGIPQLITHPDGETESAVVSNRGWIQSVTDQNGYKTQYGHDAAGRINLITYPTGDTTAWNSTSITFEKMAAADTYFTAGHWRETISTGNGRKVTWYDTKWQPLMSREYDTANATGTQRFNAWSHDADGRVTFTAYPRATATGLSSFTQGTWTEYDALGRQTSSTQDSELASSPLLVTLTEYLPGFQTRTTNPRGHATTTSFYAWDQPDTSKPYVITAPEGATTTMTLDTLGRTTRVRRSGPWDGSTLSFSREYRYNAYGELEKAYSQEERTTYFDYDAAGNVQYTYKCSSYQDVNCGWTVEGGRPAVHSTRTYDELNRLATETFADGVNDRTYGYTDDGLLETLTSDDSTWTYTYNKRRLLSREKMFFYSDYIVDHTYDANGHLASDDYGVLQVNYAPNALGQPTQAGTWATGVSYHPNGAVKQFTYGNGIVHTMAQNVRGLPATSRDLYGATEYIDYTVTYDANGNTATASNGITGSYGFSRTMSYDGRDRLTGVASVGGRWSSASYTYDPIDNLRTNKLVHPSGTDDYTFTYDTSNRIDAIARAGATTWDYTHDSRGRMTGDGRQTYAWTAGDRLASVRNVGSSVDKEWYQYDGHGRRTVVWRQDGTGSVPMYGKDGKLWLTSDNRLGGANMHIYLGDDNIADVFYNWSTGLQPAEYHHTDPLGTPIARTSQGKSVLNRFDDAPYGRTMPAMTDDGRLNDIGYTGHAYDTSTGLVYMQQRYFNPMTGRFLTPDPVATGITNGAGFDRYGYAQNNPYRFIDPDGRQAQPNYVFPAGISRTTGIPQNAAQAEAWSNPKPTPMNNQKVADQLDDYSTKAGVLGAATWWAQDFSAVADAASIGLAVAAVAIDPTDERIDALLLGGAMAGSGKLAAAHGDEAISTVMTTTYDGLEGTKATIETYDHFDKSDKRASMPLSNGRPKNKGGG